MKSTIAICLLSGLVIQAAFCADEVATNSNPLPDNPYSQIIVRNVFNLVPVTADAAPVEANPPPKITPTGIQNFFGKAWALFKVSGVARPGQPPQDKNYMLSEGQRSDEIEVKHIDEKNHIIVFDNHGETQPLPLTVAASSGGGSPTPLPNGNPGFTPPGGGDNNFPGRGFGRFGQRGGFQGRGGNANPNSGANPANGGDGLSLRSVPTRSSSQDNKQQLTPEEQVILMEANRAMTQDQVNQGNMPPLPVTPVTPEDATGYGGAPIVK